MNVLTRGLLLVVLQVSLIVALLVLRRARIGKCRAGGSGAGLFSFVG